MSKLALMLGALLGPGLLTGIASAGSVPEPDPKVLALALKAVDCAEQAGVEPGQRRLTLIDYSLPSSKRRLWVLDLETRQWLFHELVAHGKNTGGNLATQFSNQPQSLQSSLGLFLTGGSYSGKHGLSLRLRGLEPGFNDKAFARAVVLHGAAYVSEKMIRDCGRIGRSWGCPAVRPAVTKRLIRAIRNGSFLFSYYPDPTWLASSKMLRTCDAGKKSVARTAASKKASKPAASARGKRARTG